MNFKQKALAIIVGSIFLSIGINFFLIPFELLDGGIIGIGLIINYLLGLKAGLVIIFLSIPIFILAWIYNRTYFFNSLHGMLFSSFVIDLLFPFHENFTSTFSISPIISSIFGGIFVGLGIGIMLRFETSTGGTDLIAQFLSEKLYINVGLMIFIIDALVIIAGGLLLSRDTFILSALTITFVGVATSLCTINKKGEVV
ncbi:YitT family protein [Bacillus sp. CGMCC 1.16607]|uniref:YitT family protein n=1 Tax=Bacillus sp. CGMCC 1.16607 TaxID=3351842 RepID=UPI0036286861